MSDLSKLDALADRASAAQQSRDAAYAELAAEVRALASQGVPETRLAVLAGVTRVTVRKWVGKD